jgi:hypothetical protein
VQQPKKELGFVLQDLALKIKFADFVPDFIWDQVYFLDDCLNLFGQC